MTVVLIKRTYLPILYANFTFLESLQRKINIFKFKYINIKRLLIKNSSKIKILTCLDKKKISDFNAYLIQY